MHRKEKIDVLHVWTSHYLHLLNYKLIAKLTGAKLVFEYSEYRLGWGSRGLYQDLNSLWICKKAPKLWDGVFCISYLLKSEALKVNEKLKTMIITPICDITMFDNVVPAEEPEPYLLYVCSTSHIKRMAIESWQKSELHDKVKLYLVLRGPKDKIAEIAAMDDRIVTMSGIPYSRLLSLYKGATGLLIPLRENIQDMARFPNKICEYLSASGVMLTTRYGEIAHYFTHGKNALIAQDFSVEAYAEMMNWLSQHLDEVDSIKQNAYKLGKEHFHTMSYCKEMEKFLMEVVNG